MKRSKRFLYVLVMFVVLSITIGYAALGSEMSISGVVAEIRLKKDIRVTDFLYSDSTSSASVSSVEYSNKALITDVVLPNSDSSVTYKVEVTNFGNVEMGIYELTGLPNNLTYEVSDYTLKEKICDESNVCSSGIVKTFFVTIKYATNGYSSTNTVYSLDMKVDFRQFYSISYSDITINNYPTEVISGDTLKITFADPIPSSVSVYLDGLEVDLSLYSFVDGILTYNNVLGNVVIKGPRTLYSIMKMATNGPDTNIDFSLPSSATNGDGVNTVSGTENDEYPIYYYRGAVENNNVLFAGYCWKMVRTTDLGGIKLIYNGQPETTFSLDYTRKLQQNEYINLANDSSQAYTFDSSTLSWENSISDRESTRKIYFSISKSGYYSLEYKLDSEGREKAGNIYVNESSVHSLPYSCLDACNDNVYLGYLTNEDVIGLELGSTSIIYADISFSILEIEKQTQSCETKGENNIGVSYFNSSWCLVDDVRYIYADGTDSTIKSFIDNWYESNIIGYTNFLQDEKWCNDRSISGSTTYFGPYERLYNNMSPSLECENDYQLMVSTSDIDKHLKYPVALLTADEMVFAGIMIYGNSSAFPDTNFLSGSGNFWTLSPSYMNGSSAEVWWYYDYNIALRRASMDGDGVSDNVPVRPSIVLKNGISIHDGTGVATDPYTLDV